MHQGVAVFWHLKDELYMSVSGARKKPSKQRVVCRAVRSRDATRGSSAASAERRAVALESPKTTAFVPEIETKLTGVRFVEGGSFVRTTAIEKPDAHQAFLLCFGERPNLLLP